MNTGKAGMGIMCLERGELPYDFSQATIALLNYLERSHHEEKDIETRPQKIEPGRAICGRDVRILS